MQTLLSQVTTVVNLQVFHSNEPVSTQTKDLQGNAAKLFIFDTRTTNVVRHDVKNRVKDLQQMQAIAHAHQDVCCFLFIDHQAHALFCFNPSQAIECCGHGAFAAAHYLQQIKHPLAHRPLTQAGCKIETDAAHGIGLSALEVKPCPVPLWASEVINIEATNSEGINSEGINSPVLDAAIAGGESGYLVLGLSDCVDLAALKPNLAALCKHTKRALILTLWPSAQTKNTKKRYYLRYFAPQYGTDEDAVTASAQRVLAPYWQQKKYPKQTICNFDAVQLSSSGGRLAITMNNNTVWVSGEAMQTHPH